MIDFHCHLDLYEDAPTLVGRCEREGIYVLSVTTTPSAWRGTVALSNGAKRIRTALGLHPQIAHERFAELRLFDELLPETEYVGEIGLDRSPGTEQTWSTQLAVLRHILAACAAASGRILSIHSRRAASQVLDQLAEFPNAGTPVLHWFSGTQRELLRAIEMGCWFSVGPAMLRAERGRSLAQKMPRDRVLTESDGPFAQSKGRPLIPPDVKLAVDALAELWQCDEITANKTLADNLRRLVTK